LPQRFAHELSALIARFDPDDDILAELDTLKAWVKQSYVAVAPKKLGRVVG
jgi:hypothetical protein